MSKKYAKISNRFKVKKMGLAGNLENTNYGGRSNTQEISYVKDSSALGNDSLNINGNNIGQYAGYAVAAGNAISNYNGIQKNADLTQKQKADATYDMAATIGKSVNPVVGALWGLGDAIGEPIKANSERLNENGTLANREGAKISAVAGAFFNPLKALTTRSSYKGGWSDITGSKYLDSLEADSKAQYAEEQARIAAEEKANRKRKYDEQMNYSKAYNMVNPITGREGVGIYAGGGSIPKGYLPNTNVHYLEKGENPMSREQLQALGLKYETNTGGFDEYSTADGNRMFYKPIAYGSNEWNNNANPLVTNTVPITPIVNTFKPKYPRVGTPEWQENQKVINNLRLARTTFATGGTLNLPYDRKAIGGDLVPLSSETTKAVGDTHQQDTNNDGQTGILLTDNKKPLAEVENKEIMDGTKVYSEKLKFKPGVSYAKQAEILGRKKGKFELKLDSTDYREVNTAKRKLSHINEDLENLFNHQEASKGVLPVNNGVPKASKGLDLNRGSLTAEEIADEKEYANRNFSGRSNYQSVDWAKTASDMIPYIDNMYNSGIIGQTPNIPKPVNKSSYDLTPVTLKTNYNVQPALNENNRSYRLLTKDLNENTANSVTARGNKLAAFANLIDNTSKIYGNKENIETDLINKNNMNVQAVTDRNLTNRQTVDNQNVDSENAYRWAKMQRTSDINAMKSANMSNLVDNMTTQVQDRNMGTLDEQRIMMDALKYNDASGFANSIGTPVMDNLIRSNNAYYKQIENSLISAGQNSALEKFYKYYGKKN